MRGASIHFFVNNSFNFNTHMLQLKSKTVIIKGNPEKVYEFVSDFRNMQNMLPEDIMKNIEIYDQRCRFDVPGIGRVGIKIAEKTPFSKIRIMADENSPGDFNLWMNLEPHPENQTKVDFVLHAGLNMIIEAMAKKPLQQFIDMLADKIEQKDFSQPK